MGFASLGAAAPLWFAVQSRRRSPPRGRGLARRRCGARKKGVRRGGWRAGAPEGRATSRAVHLVGPRREAGEKPLASAPPPLGPRRALGGWARGCRRPKAPMGRGASEGDFGPLRLARARFVTHRGRGGDAREVAGSSVPRRAPGPRASGHPPPVVDSPGLPHRL